QIGTPEEILTEPANDYVRAFVKNVDRTRAITASTIMHRPPTITVPKDGPGAAVRRMKQAGVSTVYVVDADRRLQGILTIDGAIALQKQQTRDVTVAVDGVYTTSPQTTVRELLTTALSAKYPIAVLGEDRTLLGILDRASVLAQVAGDEDDEATPLSELLDEDIRSSA